jgi:hypothetical protein
MNKEEFLSKRDAIDLMLKDLNGEKEKLEKEYIESNQGFPIGSKVCITVPAHERFSPLNNEIGHLKPLNVFGYESSDDAFYTNSSDYQYHTQEPYVPIYPLSA